MGMVVGAVPILRAPAPAQGPLAVSGGANLGSTADPGLPTLLDLGHSSMSAVVQEDKIHEELEHRASLSWENGNGEPGSAGRCTPLPVPWPGAQRST